MKTKQTFIPLMWVKRGLLLVVLLSLNGCDYWPPALQSQIEGLQAELNDALDDRQRLDQELTELRSAHESVQREIEEKARKNEALQLRLAALPRTPNRTAPAQYAMQRNEGRVLRQPASRKDRPTPSQIQKGAYVTLQLEEPRRRGPQVVRLQRLLRRHDFPIRVDGIYGPTTAAAIRSFQRVHGLPTDGIAGPSTYNALRRALPTYQLVRRLEYQRPPLSGRDVSTVQRALHHAGYRIPIDGHFGPATKRAVIRFQRKHGLTPDGMVGPQTWAELRITR